MGIGRGETHINSLPPLQGDPSQDSPGFLRRLSRAGAHALRATLLASDISTLRAIWRLQRPGNEQGALVPLRIRQLGGETVWVREGTTDIVTVTAAFLEGRHRPAGHERTGLIWDIGANVGMTMRDLAHRYPEAQVVGVEMDPDNAAVAIRNVAACGGRCEVVQAAASPSPGVVRYALQKGAEAEGQLDSGGELTATAVTLDQLAQRTGAPDFVKFDVEGAERDLLRSGTGWAADVGQITVEIHEPQYSTAECRRDLEALGFAVSIRRRSRLKRQTLDTAVGVREQTDATGPATARD